MSKNEVITTNNTAEAKTNPFTCFIFGVIIRQTQYEKISDSDNAWYRRRNVANTNMGEATSFPISK